MADIIFNIPRKGYCVPDFKRVFRGVLVREKGINVPVCVLTVRKGERSLLVRKNQEVGQIRREEDDGFVIGLRKVGLGRNRGGVV